MKIVKLNRNLFREYDLRGIVGELIDVNVAYTLGKSYGSYIQEKGHKKAIIGYDNRCSSVDLSNALIQGITETGVDVINLGLVTSPMFYFGRYHYKINAGVMITASHNPKEYNGFKISWDEIGNAYGEKIVDFYNFTEKGEFLSGEGKVETVNVAKDYLNLIKASINLGPKKIKAVIDCGNGTASTIVKEMMDMFDIEWHPLYCESDGTFPNHHPDPSLEKYTTDLQAKVVELGYDVGIGIDGDGDRVGIIDNKGIFYTADFFILLICRSLKGKLNENKTLYDVKCSKSLIDDLDAHGINGVMYRTGNSYVNKEMIEGNYTFGGEYSGHVYFRDRYPGFDDGLYAGLRLIEILSNSDQTINEMMETVPKYVSEYFDYRVTDDNKFLIVEEFVEYVKSQNYEVITLDGARLNLEDGWALVRASNTSPNLTLRYESLTQEGLDKIKEYILKILDQIKSKH